MYIIKQPKCVFILGTVSTDANSYAFTIVRYIHCVSRIYVTSIMFMLVSISGVMLMMSKLVRIIVISMMSTLASKYVMSMIVKNMDFHDVPNVWMSMMLPMSTMDLWIRHSCAVSGMTSSLTCVLLNSDIVNIWTVWYWRPWCEDSTVTISSPVLAWTPGLAGCSWCNR